MATALIPIITNLLPAAIPTLVQVAEVLFGKGTGKSKMAAVVSAVKSFISSLATGGNTPPPPSDAEIEALVETVVQDLKAKNQLPAQATAAGSTATSQKGFQLTVTPL
jgi:hypothetical protein